MMTQPNSRMTRLTQTDLKAIERQFAQERQLLGEPPSLESLIEMGYRENKWLHLTIQAISSFGRVVTLLVSELIQSVAVLLLLVVFGLLEYFRVQHGAIALNQPIEQAQLIAFAVVTANIVHPIYSLRSLRGQTEYKVVRPTLRGWIESFGRRLFARPQVETVSWSFNPTLSIASAVISWTTIILASYDLISPLVTSMLTGTATKPTVILVTELVMGLGLSISGVMFLQSASTEIAIKLITDAPKSITETLEEHQQAYEAKLEALHTKISEQVMQARLADLRRREAKKVSDDPLSVTPTMINQVGIAQASNGNAPNAHE